MNILIQVIFKFSATNQRFKTLDAGFLLGLAVLEVLQWTSLIKDLLTECKKGALCCYGLMDADSLFRAYIKNVSLQLFYNSIKKNVYVACLFKSLKQ